MLGVPDAGILTQFPLEVNPPAGIWRYTAFTHALREEGDILLDETYRELMVSIHILRKEGDFWNYWNNNYMSQHVIKTDKYLDELNGKQ